MPSHETPEVLTPEEFAKHLINLISKAYYPNESVINAVEMRDERIRREARRVVVTYPHPCGLCPGMIESAEDTEWHGLGDCVPICDSCKGSGIGQPPPDSPTPEEEIQ